MIWKILGIEETKDERSKKRLELEQIKSDLQGEFIHQNTARLNIITAREKMEETEWECAYWGNKEWAIVGVDEKTVEEFCTQFIKSGCKVTISIINKK